VTILEIGDLFSYSNVSRTFSDIKGCAILPLNSVLPDDLALEIDGNGVRLPIAPETVVKLPEKSVTLTFSYSWTLERTNSPIPGYVDKVRFLLLQEGEGIHYRVWQKKSRVAWTSNAQWGNIRIQNLNYAFGVFSIEATASGTGFTAPIEIVATDLDASDGLMTDSQMVIDYLSTYKSSSENANEFNDGHVKFPFWPVIQFYSNPGLASPPTLNLNVTITLVR